MSAGCCGPFVSSFTGGSGGGGGGGIDGIAVQDEGVPIGPGPFTTLDFVGNDVQATDVGGGVAQINIGGPGAWNVRGPFTSVGAPHAAAVKDLMMADVSAGAFAFTLPAVGLTNKGGQICFKKTTGGSTNFSITPNGANTIDGVNADYVVGGALSAVTLVSDGVSNWMVI